MDTTNKALYYNELNFFLKKFHLTKLLKQKIEEIPFEQILKSSIKDISKEEYFKLFLSIYNNATFSAINFLEIFITEDCNMHCDYCFVKQKRKNNITSDTLKSAINFLILYSRNKSNLSITLFGGEPLLKTNLIYDTLQYCNELSGKVNKSFNFNITTNGILLNDEILKNTSKHISYLLSIDGDEYTHNKHRKLTNGVGSFNNVFPKIGLLKQYQQWLGARMTVYPDTVSNLLQNIDFLYNNGINQFIIGICYGPKWDNSSLAIYEKQLKEVGNYYKNKVQNKEQIRMTLFEKNNSNCYENVWGCSAGRNGMAIASNGDIYPCSKFIGLEKYSCPEFLLGNVNIGITNLIGREKLFTITNKDFNHCEQCKEIASCSGGCISENYNQNRSIYIPCKDQCEITKIQNRVLRKFWAEQERATEKMAT